MAGTVPIHLVPSGNADERRRATRKQVSWPAKLEVNDGWLDCQVMDLSPTGAKVRISGPLTGTNLVRISVDQLGVFDGTVVWAHRVQRRHWRFSRKRISFHSLYVKQPERSRS